ncbi:hypothetical protein MMC15_004022 [Xylographa vitiligo]|nr:hypothetical protein [Xylographa vitiligo]
MSSQSPANNEKAARARNSDQAMHRYLREDDPYRRFLVVGPDKSQTASKSGNHDEGRTSGPHAIHYLKVQGGGLLDLPGRKRGQ